HWCAGCEGIVQLVAIMPDGGRVQTFNVEPHDDWNAAAAWAREQSENGRNVYFCAVTQRPGTTGHRTEATAYELPGVFADVDDADPETTWPTIEATGHVTAGVASGAGLHIYARIPKPIRVTNDGREQLKDTTYAYGAGVNAAMHGEARKVDRFDMASLVRV